ncbi:transketolase [Roseibium algae]|uniref:Transketolase n=1 Tax=Roseibium algae TaxID=3123038 RepID=A0ABU8TNK9_9HYPH
MAHSSNVIAHPNDPVPVIRDRALWMRRRAFKMVYDAQLGHPGGDFSAIDAIATLYFGVLHYDPKQPELPGRDRFIMSKGHATGALYTALCAAGYFEESWLDTYMQPQSKLNGHPNRNYVPGVETNTGPLGHGVPVALGIAIAGQITGANHRTYVLTGDGELQEGSNWEAAMTAGHRKLENMTLIVDRNRLQQGAGTEETNSLDPLDGKFRAFGWHVEIVDGHDHEALFTALSAPCKGRGKPLCVIANTVKGKGVSFMENQASWHHGVPNAEQFDTAMKELV